MRFALRTLLITALIAQTVATTVVVGYFSYSNGQRAVQEVVSQLLYETGQHVAHQLDTYFDFVQSGASLGVSSLEAKPHYRENVERFHQAASPQDDQDATLRHPVFGTHESQFEATDRSPALLAAGRLAATDDERGELLGGVAAQIDLNHLDQFLKTLKPRETAEIFIVEPGGLLLADSRPGLPYRTHQANTEQVTFQRLSVDDQLRALIISQSQSRTADNQQSSAGQIPLSHQVQMGDERYFVQVLPYQYGEELNWLIVTALSEATLPPISSPQSGQILGFGLFVLLSSVGLGLWLTRCIARPILALDQVIRALVTSRYSLATIFPSSNIRELASLVNTVRQMVAQLPVLQCSEPLQKQPSEQALDASEARLRLLADAIPVCIAYVSANQRYCLVNQTYEAWFGCSKQDIIGKTVANLMGTQAYATIHPYIEHVLAGETVAYETQITDVDGENRDISGVLVPDMGHDSQVRGYFSLITDISDRKRTEEALRQSRERYRVATTAGGIYVWDWKPSTDEFFVDNDFQKWLGYGAHDIAQTRTAWQQATHPADWPIIEQAIKAHLSGETEEYRLEHQVLHKDGTLRWVLARGRAIRDGEANLLRVSGTLTDITDRKQAEIALTESEVRWRSILESMPVMLNALDGQGRFIFWNAECERVTGYSASEILAVEDPFPLLYPDATYRRQIIDNYKQLGRSFRNWEITLTAKSGEQRTVVWSNISHDFPVLGWSNWEIGIDITERKQAELELAAAKDAAEAANRAKSVFVANISHELRSPLNAILGFARLLKEARSLDTEQQDHAKIIERSGEHLLNVINQVLDLAKIEANSVILNPVNVDLDSLLNDLHSLLSLKAEDKGLTFEFQRSADLPQRVRTDDIKLRQVLINLLDNAIKFTELGSVVLKVYLHPLQPGPDHVRLKFEVTDTGFGIAPEEQAKLFQAFSQTRVGRKQHQGTGLGLVITHAFVQLMGGDIACQSQPGQGTTFQFDIVADAIHEVPERGQKDLRRIVGLAEGQAQPKLLIVDDNAVNRLLLKKLLSILDIPIQEARDGEEAIAHWRSWQPDLILMDLRMPRLDGYQATRHIRRMERQTHNLEHEVPIVAISATGTEDSTRAALEAGCNTFVHKPFRRTEIFDCLQNHLNLKYVYAEETDF